MFNLFELIYNFFVGKNKKEEQTVQVVEVQPEVVVKKIKKPRKKKVEK